MKKIITILAFVALSTVSAKAIDLPAMPSLGAFSLTGGLAANQGVFGASATEINQGGDGLDRSRKKEHGVFSESYNSQFVELGVGPWISVGYEHTPDSVSTPQNTTRQYNASEIATVSVDFNDMNTTYVKLNLPYFTGMYAKFGTVKTDLDIKEVMGSGSKYKNKSTNGEVVGIGYAGYLKETGFGFRIEGSYLTLDPVSTDNGVAKGTVNAAAGSVNNNRIDATNLEGLQAKVAVVYTFGRN
jgi:hypothetical protein